ncbi:unnamed protein product, partial [Rotaria sp. Silwood1]
LQEYARKVAEELGDQSGNFKASNGWLDRFRTRHNIHFRIICGEAAAVDKITTENWQMRLPNIIQHYNPVDIYNCDETGLFFKLMPDRSLVIDKNDCKGGKKSRDRYTVMLCTNWLGTDKLKPVVIGKAARPRCFKNIDMTKLPVTWHSNRTAWMNSKIFTEWLYDLDLMMQKQKRNILLFLDNAPVHSPDVKLQNVALKFFPANSTAQIQPLDQGIIRTFKAYYRRYLVKHIIANANAAHTADDVKITALDAICWIDQSWTSITEATIRNTFKVAGFEMPVVLDDSASVTLKLDTTDVVVNENKCIEDLDQVLKHISIGGTVMSANDFVNIDDGVPVYNEWDDASDKMLTVNGINFEDAVNDEDTTEQPPSLSEAMNMIRRLHLLSITQQPELHLYYFEQSRIADVAGIIGITNVGNLQRRLVDTR